MPLISGHIITQMENRSMLAGFDTVWVVNTMALSKIPIVLLLRTYNKIYKTKASHLFMFKQHQITSLDLFLMLYPYSYFCLVVKKLATCM